MKKAVKIIGVVLAIPVAAYSIWAIDTFVYPFKAETPNYSHVEKAFAKLQFPADWKEISSSENRGLHGRGCDPLNSAGCFHKKVTFKVKDSLTNEDVKSFLSNNSCSGITEDEFTYDGESKQSFGFNCVLGDGLRLGLSLRGPESTLSVAVKTY